jgi:hypothetical protein
MNGMFHSYSPVTACFEWYLLNCCNIKERQEGRRGGIIIRQIKIRDRNMRREQDKVATVYTRNDVMPN